VVLELFGFDREFVQVEQIALRLSTVLVGDKDLIFSILIYFH